MHAQGQAQRTSTQQKASSPTWREKIVISLFDPQEFRRKFNADLQNEINISAYRYAKTMRMCQRVSRPRGERSSTERQNVVSQFGCQRCIPPGFSDISARRDGHWPAIPRCLYFRCKPLRYELAVCRGQFAYVLRQWVVRQIIARQENANFGFLLLCC